MKRMEKHRHTDFIPSPVLDNVLCINCIYKHSLIELTDIWFTLFTHPNSWYSVTLYRGVFTLLGFYLYTFLLINRDFPAYKHNNTLS